MLNGNFKENDEEKPALIPAEEAMVLYYYINGEHTANILNQVMPHRSVDDWGIWVDMLQQRPDFHAKVKEAMREINKEETLKRCKTVIAQKYPQWYPEVLEKPPVPAVYHSVKSLKGLSPDVVCWLSHLEEDGKDTDANEDTMDDLLLEYPHLNSAYTDKFHRYLMRSDLKQCIKDAQELMKSHGQEYQEWLEKAYPDHYGQTRYELVKQRKVTAEEWEKITKNLKEATSGRMAMKQLQEFLPIKVIQEAFFRSSGEIGPAIRFLKDTSVAKHIRGSWSTPEDLDLLRDEYVEDLENFHGIDSVRKRRAFLLDHVQRAKALESQGLKRPVSAVLKTLPMDTVERQAKRQTKDSFSLFPETKGWLALQTGASTSGVN